MSELRKCALEGCSEIIASKRAWKRFCVGLHRERYHCLKRKETRILAKRERNGAVSSVAFKLLFVVSTLGPGIYLWVERSGYIHACLSFVC